MPVPLTAEMVDEYMLPVPLAARDGELSRISWSSNRVGWGRCGKSGGKFRSSCKIHRKHPVFLVGSGKVLIL